MFVRSLCAAAILAVGVAMPAAAQTDPHAGHAAEAAQAAQTPAPVNEALPPGEEHAKDALNRSPRHGEWADIVVAGEAAPIRAFVAYPERRDKAGVVIVIHEIYGLTDWIRGVTDQLAEDGFIAIAPDLVCGKGPNGGCTDSAASRDDVVKMVRGLTPAEVVGRLNAVRDYALKLPAANGKTATVGYCWGGSTSFSYAAAQPGLDAAVVYYGGSPSDPASLAAIRAPVLGLYGGDDARVNATIEPAAVEMKKLGKVFETHVYDGAGHGFLRAQAGRDGANLRATEQAWPTTLAFLRKHLK